MEELDQIQLRSDEVQEILSYVPHWMIRWGNALFLILILLLLSVTWFVKYPDIITTDVMITTEIPPQKEYAKATGKLTQILVQDNQLVIPSQALAILENTANYKDVFLIKSMLDSLSIRKDDFYFPFEDLPVLFLGEIESDFALFENAYLHYNLNKELQPFFAEVLANQTSILELRRRLQDLLSQKDLYESELAYEEKDLARQKDLYQKGVIASQTFENKQLTVLRAQRNFKSIALSISQTKQAIGNAQKSSRGTTINKTREEVVLQKNLIQSFNRVKKSIKEWEVHYVLQAKINGTVTFLNHWSNNQNVNLGDLVFTIIPEENSRFIAKLQAPAHNSGKIEVGQAVNIKLQNYPETEFGMLRGEVASISSIVNKEGYYYIAVNLPEKLITSYHKELVFKQEMSGTADIITADLRLLERFFYQFRNLLKRS